MEIKHLDETFVAYVVEQFGKINGRFDGVDRRLMVVEGKIDAMQEDITTIYDLTSYVMNNAVHKNEVTHFSVA